MARKCCPSTRRSTSTLTPASVCRTWKRSRASMLMGMGSIPCPYTTAGTRPCARTLRATPLPAPSRRSPFSFCSIVASEIPPGEDRREIYSWDRDCTERAGRQPRAGTSLRLVLPVEDLRDRFVLEHGLERRGYDRGDGQNGQSVAQNLDLFLGDGKGVRDDRRLDRGLHQTLHGLVGEQGMRGGRIDIGGALIGQRPGARHHGAARIDHVVDQ